MIEHPPSPDETLLIGVIVAPFGVRSCASRLKRRPMPSNFASAEAIVSADTPSCQPIAAAANGDPYQLSELVAESYSDRVYQCLPPPEPKGPRPKLPKDFREFGRLVFSSGEQIAQLSMRFGLTDAKLQHGPVA